MATSINLHDLHEDTRTDALEASVPVHTDGNDDADSGSDGEVRPVGRVVFGLHTARHACMHVQL